MDEQPIIPLASPEPDQTPASPPDPSAIPPSAPIPAGYTPPAPVPPVTSEPPVTETPAPASAPTPPAGGKHTWVWIFVLLFILGGAGGGYYYYKNRAKSSSSGSSPAKTTTDPTLSWATFSVADFPFTLRYPSGWKVIGNYLVSPGIDPANVPTNSNSKNGVSGSVTTAMPLQVPVGEAAFVLLYSLGIKETYNDIKQKSTDSSLTQDGRDYYTAILNSLKPGDSPVDVAAAESFLVGEVNAEQDKGKANVIHTVNMEKTTLGGLSVPVETRKFKGETDTDTSVNKLYFVLQKGDYIHGFTAMLTINGDKDRSKEVDQIAATLKVQ